eukprot:10046277-Alexandrium_andersonii.AAC.1
MPCAVPFWGPSAPRSACTAAHFGTRGLDSTPHSPSPSTFYTPITWAHFTLGRSAQCGPFWRRRCG